MKLAVRQYQRMALFVLVSGAAMNAAQALEFSPGDYEMLPDNATFFLTYLQYNHSDAYYSQGNKAAGDNKLKSEVSMLRLIHAYHPMENVSIQPQVILPFGNVTAYGDSRALGDASGIGDVVVGSPVVVNMDPAGTNVLALGPYIYLPTGHYNNDNPLNMGENRWRFLLQAAWIHHFTPHWAFDTGADVSWVTPNDDYGASGQTLEQKPRYEYQAYLRYDFTPQTRVGFGGGWITGAESSVGGVNQRDRLNTTYARISASHFFTPSVQLQAVLGRDLDVKQGFKQDLNATLRLGVLF
ncbi:transporter [Lonsdalea britannica]|nr:transporter [Lonsdalea britannica]